jgi:CubicO group peptidase (beta-lactamase class C family)
MIEGTLHPDFWAVAQVLQQQLTGKRVGGAAVCVYHRGEPVVDIWAGSKDASAHPWQADTMSVSFSTTKGVAATAVHVLVDRGVLDYDDPVARYWPEFGCNGKEQITVRHILCHEAGLYGLRHRIDHAKRMLDWPFMIDVLERSTPAHAPGAANAYHALSYGWLVGELVQRASGRSFSEFIRTEIAEPLQLDGCHIGVPEDSLPRVAQLIRAKQLTRPPDGIERWARRMHRIFTTLHLPLDLKRMADALVPHGVEELDWSGPEVLGACIPAANGVFTARSLAKLYATLGSGGALNGTRLLSESTLRRATQVQNRRIDLVIPFPMHWRLGYHRGGTSRGTLRQAFGHHGFGGSGAWTDPERELAVALVLNSGVGTPLGDLRVLQIGAAAVRCAQRR